MTGLGWQPAHGATVHLARGNSCQLAAGRYRLDQVALSSAWWLHPIGGGDPRGANTQDLQQMEAAGILTPISATEIDRERQILQLRALAPMRGRRGGQLAAQFGTADLALFAAADQPGLF